MKKVFIILCMVIMLWADVIENSNSALVGNYSTPKIITIRKLQLIYRGKIKRWSDGSKIIIIVLPMYDINQLEMLLNILGISITKMRQIIKSSNNFIQIKKGYTLLYKLHRTKGSIGITSKYDAELITSSGIHKIRIVR